MKTPIAKSPAESRALPRLAAAALIVLGCAAYFNCFHGVFLFDDEKHILGNPAISSLWPLSQSMFAALNAARPLVGLSFALNYALSGYNIWSYHLFNLLVHLLSGLALFGIVRLACGSPRLAEEWAPRALGVAFTAALFWTVHPMHTQAVTYITQRFQSMMGLFYLLTVYFSLKVFGGAEDRPRYFFEACAALCCLAGMACKQDMLTAPLLVLLLDRAFFAGGFAAALKKNARLYLGLAAGWALLAVLSGAAPKAYFAGFFNTPVTPADYALTQLAVITNYISLSFLRGDFCFDYRWSTVHSIKEVLPQAVFICALLAATAWAWLKRSPWAAPGSWFFGTLAVSSSFFPIADFSCEYRMYLPLAAITTLSAMAVWKAGGLVPGRWRGLFLVLAVSLPGIVLMRRTYRENKVYADVDVLWADVAKKRPQNSRAWNNVGVGYEIKGDLPNAVACYLRSYAIDPSYGAVLDSLARAEIKLGRTKDAIAHLEQAVAGYPVYRYPMPHFRLAELLAQKGLAAEAILNYERAIEIDPNFAEAYYGLGTLYVRLGQAPRGAPYLQKAAALGRFNVK